jgi:hypothetical protein
MPRATATRTAQVSKPTPIKSGTLDATLVAAWESDPVATAVLPAASAVPVTADFPLPFALELLVPLPLLVLLP